MKACAIGTALIVAVLLVAALSAPAQAHDWIPFWKCHMCPEGTNPFWWFR